MCAAKHFNSFSLTKSTTEFECELRYYDVVNLYIPNFLQNSEYDQEIPQSQTADKPMAPTEIIKSFYSIHFYLDVLLIK